MTEFIPDTSSVAENGIVKMGKQFVLSLFDQYHRPYLVFHNYHLQYQTVEQAKEICLAEKIDEATLETVLLTAWFYNVGYQVDYRNGPAQSMRQLGQFFAKHSYDEQKRKRVVSCLQELNQQQQPVRQEAKIISDAFFIAAYLTDFEQRMTLLTAEHSFMKDREEIYQDTAINHIAHLESIHLWTAYAKVNYGDKISQLLTEEYRQKTKKDRKIEAQDEQSSFSGLEKGGVPSRGAQTLFRTNFRNHINLSSIADNKANIMISVNTILISILITVLSYRNIAETQPMILLPVTLFLITGLASLIAAVLSARPKVTSQDISTVTKDVLKKNIIFFGTFSRLKLEDYEEMMDELLRDEGLLYGNMVRDLYYLGKVLDQKYRYLSLSYNIFMMGFVVTVGSFLFILFG